MSLNKTQSEEFNSKEYRENLLAAFSIQENLFENAIESLIFSFKKSVEELEAEFNELIKVLPPEEDFDEDGHRLLRFRTLTGIHNQQSWQKEQWLALNEMRVIYMFKNLEISLKSLIKTAYPSANIKDLYKWDSIINFFKQKNIDVSSLSGYWEANELRSLNNNLKHSLTIGADVRRIQEFKDAEYLDNPLIESFLTRVGSNVKCFQTNLIEEVRRDLYEFSEERLNSMAMDYFKRLNKNQAHLLITKIQELYE